MKLFEKVLTEFNKNNIRYCILRNYEFLLDPKTLSGFDFDIMIHKEDLKKTDIIFKKFNFLKYPPQFSRKHQGYGKYIPQAHRKIGFDIQKNGIHWNDMSYLEAEQIIPRRIKKGFLYTLSDEDAFIMYLCHSILGKRYFKEKYKSILISLTKKDLDIAYIKSNLKRIFNKNISKKLINWVYRGNFKAIKKRFYLLIIYFILKKPKHWLIFTSLFFRWFFIPKYCPLRKIPLINFLFPSRPMMSFIGPDGSGKTTNALMLKKLLEKNNIKTALIYTGRGRANILPIRKIARSYKKIEEKKIQKSGTHAKRDSSLNLKKIIYTSAAPVYTIDLLLRYLFKILPKRKSGKIVITDRYATDILLMPNVPLKIKKFLLLFFPKPTLTFYLYNSPEILYERRQHPIQDLKRQLNLFQILQKKFNAIQIKTQNKKKNFDKIAEITFKKLIKSGY